MDHRINILPAPTWNRLSVNAAEAAFALPDPEKEFTARAALSVGALPDGISSADEITDPRALIAGIPAEAAAESGMGAYYDSFVKQNADHRLFLRSGAKTSAKPPVRTEIQLTQANNRAVTHHQFSTEEGASMTVIETIRSDQQVSGFTADLTEIYAKKGAHILLFQIQAAGAGCRVNQAVSVYAEEGARVEIVRAVMGGQTAAAGARTLLSGRNSVFSLHTAYFAAGTQRFDFNDIAEHFSADTNSELFTAGVLAGTADKVLRGTIDFKKGAAHAVGHESESVLLLGKGVRNRTVPLILCGEENVEGQHAASSGKPDARQIYYLCSRGLSTAEAERLIIEGRFAPILDRIPDEAVRTLLSEEIERRLSDYESSLH